VHVALERGFVLASGPTAVTGDEIAVVAALVTFDVTVTAHGQLTLFPCRRAEIASFARAACATTVVRLTIAVVTLLVTREHAIAALGHARMVGARAHPAALYVTLSAAAVVIVRVAVVADFIAVDDAV